MYGLVGNCKILGFVPNQMREPLEGLCRCVT